MSQLGSDQIPPTSGEFGIPAEPPGWPKVVGIISIVLASLSLVCGACGLINNIKNLAAGGANTQMPDGSSIHIPPPSILSVGLMVVGWIWALMLMGAGIQTLRRLAMGRMLHVVYGGVAIVLTVVSLAVTVPEVQKMMEAFSQNKQMAQMAGFVKALTYGGLCFGAVLGLGYPLFLLIWFAAMRKRPEVGAPVREPLI